MAFAGFRLHSRKPRAAARGLASDQCRAVHHLPASIPSLALGASWRRVPRFPTPILGAKKAAAPCGAAAVGTTDSSSGWCGGARPFRSEPRWRDWWAASTAGPSTRRYRRSPPIQSHCVTESPPLLRGIPAVAITARSPPGGSFPGRRRGPSLHSRALAGRGEQRLGRAPRVDVGRLTATGVAGRETAYSSHRRPCARLPVRP